VNKLTSVVFYFVSNTCMAWFSFYVSCTLIKRKPGFSGKMFWSLEIPFKTGFTLFKAQLLFSGGYYTNHIEY